MTKYTICKWLSGNYSKQFSKFDFFNIGNRLYFHIIWYMGHIYAAYIDFSDTNMTNNFWNCLSDLRCIKNSLEESNEIIFLVFPVEEWYHSVVVAQEKTFEGGQTSFAKLLINTLLIVQLLEELL